MRADLWLVRFLKRLVELFPSHNYTKSTASPCMYGFCYITFVLRLFLLYQEDERAYMSRRPWLMACFLLCPLDVSPCVPYYLALLSHSLRESNGYERKWIANGRDVEVNFNHLLILSQQSEHLTITQDKFASSLMKGIRLAFLLSFRSLCTQEKYFGYWIYIIKPPNLCIMSSY